MTCFNCGAYNPDDAAFCNKCGKKIEPYVTSQQQSRKQADAGKRVRRTMIATLIITLIASLIIYFLTLRESSPPPDESPAYIPVKK